MGDWYIGRDGKWAYDKDAPGPSTEVTQLRPAPPRDGFVAADGSAYERVTPNWFESYDEVDSRSIEDDGGPPDAA